MKRIAILGSTGSVGVNALEVVAAHPEAFEVSTLACRSNVALLTEQARRFHVPHVALFDEKGILELKRSLNSGTRIYAGADGLREVVGFPEVDLVLVAIGGAQALQPTLEAIRRKKTVAIANKECLVMAGDLLMEEVARSGATVIPVDSEHNAIFQCLQGEDRGRLHKIYLTGSGGPLRTRPKESFGRLTQEEVLAHPKWKMGKKISVDSATLMNKALEVIEAHLLFGIETKAIEILIHPEAVIHSMVEWIDGSVIAHLAPPDMKLPIQYAFSYPARIEAATPRLDFQKVGALHFEPPDLDKFPCLKFGYWAAGQGGSAPCVLNAVNEEAVGAYLEGRLPFTRIPQLIESVLGRHRFRRVLTLAELLEEDSLARDEARRYMGTTNNQIPSSK